MDDLIKTMKISGAGMKAQGTRLRVIAENVANASSLPTTPGDTPYRRQVITFKNELDRRMGLDMVQVDKVGPDRSEFGRSYEPGHPGADQDGYVRTPNVNALVEIMDMREAQRSYEANINVVRASKKMLQSTIDILK